MTPRPSISHSLHPAPAPLPPSFLTPLHPPPVAWVRAKHAIIITTSSKKERLERYLAVGGIKLSEKDVEAIDAAGKKGIPTSSRAWVGPVVVGIAGLVGVAIWTGRGMQWL